eukprot:20630-Heterococcus_DN1.PRE.3
MSARYSPAPAVSTFLQHDTQCVYVVACRLSLLCSNVEAYCNTDGVVANISRTALRSCYT